MYILYKIMNTVNDKLYIGQTKKTLNQRWSSHKSRARKGSTMAIHNAMRKYGVENFSIHPIAQATSLEEANEAEKALIIEHRSLYSENGYNITAGGSNGSFCIGIPKTEEHKRKLAKAKRKNAKPIVQFDWATGELIKVWTGQKEARRHGFSGNIFKHIKSEKGYGYAYDSGWIYLSRWEEIEDKTRPVIFSAHGVPKKIPEDAKEYNMTYVDATCPLVSKVHREAENLHKSGYHLILIGHQNHPEVIGTMGQLPEGSIDLIQNEDEAQNYSNTNNRKIAFVTQTTLSVDDTKDIIQILKSKFKDIREPLKEDICYATTNRQMAVKNIAKNCDMFFVIGSRNSSNSVRLVEVAKKSGCINSRLIHSESKIPYDEIQNSNTIGISSGASAPEILVENFINDLKNRFTIKIDEVEIIKEDVVFKIPNKLN